MFYLTNNKVEFEGRTFIQIKRKRPDGEFELGGYVEENLPKISGEVWICKGSYVFGDCELIGDIRISSNCVIRNSKLHNILFVGIGCNITNSNITGHSVQATIFDKQCVINDCTINTIGRYSPDFFCHGKFKIDTYNNVVLLMTDDYCRVNCLTMTYEMAWEYLNNEEKWNYMMTKHQDFPQIFNKDTKKWLYYWCEKQLQRKKDRR